MKINKLLVLIMVLLLNACVSRLRVKVEAADRDLVIEKVDQDLENELAMIIESVNQDFENLNSILVIYKKFINTSFDKPKDQIAKTEIELKEIEKNIKSAMNLFNPSYNSESKDDSESKNNIKTKKNNLAALALIQKSQNQIITFYDTALTIINEKNKNAEDVKAIIKDMGLKKESALKISSNTSRLRYNLLGDPLTSYVTNRKHKRKIWNSTFNQTKVVTFAGDTDIAVLLRKNPDTSVIKSGDYNNNFTIKGVKLDAEDVIEASFKALSQSVNLFASIQLAGTNLTSSNSDTAYAQLPSSVNTFLNDLKTKEQKLLEKEAYLLAVRKLLFEKIILEDFGDDKTPDQLNTSLEDVIKYWSNLKGQLETIKTK